MQNQFSSNLFGRALALPLITAPLAAAPQALQSTPAQGPAAAAAGSTACGYVLEDGGSTAALGLTVSGTLAFLNYFDAGLAGGLETITSVSVAFGTPGGSGGLDGRPVDIAIYEDPTNDFNPIDAELVHVQAGVVQNAESDTFNTFRVPDVRVAGQYFVLVSISNPLGVTPAAIDQDNPSSGRSWIVANGPGAFNLADLAANDVPPLEVAAAGFDGTFLIRAFGNASIECETRGTIYCDPGVLNSTGAASRIVALGSNVVADQQFDLYAYNVPIGEPVLFLGSKTQGFVSAPGCCNVGNLCLAGDFARFSGQTQLSDGVGSVTIAVDLNNVLTNPPQPVLAGQTWNFQAWHRDGTSSNMTTAVEVAFN